MSTNRKVHLLTATGSYAEVNGSYRAIGHTAFLTHAEAARDIPAFTERCLAENDQRLCTVVPDSLKVRVQTLDLVDTALDAESRSVFALSGGGPSAVFNRRFQCIHRRVFTERAEAERAIPGFTEACTAPCDDSLDHAIPGRFEVSLLELALAPE